MDTMSEIIYSLGIGTFAILCAVPVMLAASWLWNQSAQHHADRKRRKAERCYDDWARMWRV